MAINNENQQEPEVQSKLCPFLNKDCIQGKCVLWSEIMVMKPGNPIPHKQGMCGFIALCMILSSPKPQHTSSPLQMPRGFNPLGRG